MPGITWSHDGRLIVSGGEDGNAWFWDGESYELLGKVDAGEIARGYELVSTSSYTAGMVCSKPTDSSLRLCSGGRCSGVQIQGNRVVRVAASGHGIDLTANVLVTDLAQLFALEVFVNRDRTRCFRDAHWCKRRQSGSEFQDNPVAGADCGVGCRQPGGVSFFCNPPTNSQMKCACRAADRPSIATKEGGESIIEEPTPCGADFQPTRRRNAVGRGGFGDQQAAGVPHGIAGRFECPDLTFPCCWG